HSAKSKGRVYINAEQCFDGVKQEWWQFHIGGYQVLQKWLKDRKGRRLSHDDLIHYQRIVVAIRETIRLMAEIDKAIPGWPVG
ncbi:MAG: type ISP restriction/modification enzyme, partial [bacterium]